MTSSSAGKGCHSVPGDSGVRFASGVKGGACGETGLNLAVFGKPNFSVRSAPGASNENIHAAIEAKVVTILGRDASAFLSSAGPPYGIGAENSKAVVLRI